MQSDQKYFPQDPGAPLADQVGSGYIPSPPISTFFGQNVDLQPSKICPRNFLIFDRTDNRSQIMYHPATVHNFGYPDLNVGAPYFHDYTQVQNNVDDPREVSSFMKEDSADIDALLSLEEDEEEEFEEEEELSTARTQGNDASDTADSCSSRPRKGRLTLSTSSSSSSHKANSSERKRQKMRKMVKSLRGIVPGGNQMNTVDVLDEAVKYLKSLKVEVQKIGVGNLKN